MAIPRNQLYRLKFLFTHPHKTKQTHVLIGETDIIFIWLGRKQFKLASRRPSDRTKNSDRLFDF